MDKFKFSHTISKLKNNNLFAENKAKTTLKSLDIDASTFKQFIHGFLI